MTTHSHFRGNRFAQASPCFFALASLLALAPVGTTEEVRPTNQTKEYDAEVPKTILELQQFRQTTSIHIKSHGGREGVATLINLNPSINAWYLLRVAWKDGGAPQIAFHLENPEPDVRRFLLDESYPAGVVISDGKNRYLCELFGGNTLGQAKTSQLIFAPLCDGRVYLRSTAAGYRTTLEAATEFLRSHVWGGEKIIGLGHILMGDVHRETGKIDAEAPDATSAKAAAGQECTSAFFNRISSIREFCRVTRR